MINIAPGESLNESLISSFFRRISFTKLQMINDFNCTLEADLFEGMTNLAGINYIKIFPGPYIPFTRTLDSSSIPYLASTQLMLGFHLESGQHFFQSKFKRKRLRNDSPAFDFTVTYGFKGILQSKYNYVKFWFAMRHFMKTNPFGFNRYTIEVGKIIGRAPWPLLFIMKGNETYGFEKNCYNMMNLYEFAADEYISIVSEQHLQGRFLNFIPFLRKLNLREVL
jgi:hypothetical protein